MFDKLQAVIKKIYIFHLKNLVKANKIISISCFDFGERGEEGKKFFIVKSGIKYFE